MYRIIVCSLTLLLICSLRSEAVPPTNCAEGLKKAYKTEQENMRTILASGNAWYLKYTMISDALNNTNKYQRTTSSGELMGDKNIRYISSDKVEVVMDEQDVFTINKINKSVMRTKSSAEALAVKSDVYAALMQEKLLKDYQIVSCNEYVIMHGDSATLMYQLAPKDKKKCLYSKIEIYVATNTFLLKRIDIDVNPLVSRKVKHYTMIINEHGEKKLDNTWTKASSRVFENNGAFKPQYLGYRYNDYKKLNK